jgi:hypothetical protein
MTQITISTPAGEVTKTTTSVGDGVYQAGGPKPIPANLTFPMDDPAPIVPTLPTSNATGK